MDQALNSQKTPHTSPLRASYGMSFVSILMKNDRVIKGFYCITNTVFKAPSRQNNIHHTSNSKYDIYHTTVLEAKSFYFAYQRFKNILDIQTQKQNYHDKQINLQISISS